MYTDAMKRAFKSIPAPAGFKVELYDNDDFLTLKADAKQFLDMYHDQKIEAAEYLIRVKKALESEGAMVLLVRTALDDGE
jgi:hypothetical protein